MRLETFSLPTKEIEVSNDDVTAVATPWGNCEGVNVFIHSNAPGMPLKTFFAMKWEEIDVLMVALQAAIWLRRCGDQNCGLAGSADTLSQSLSAFL